MEQIGIAFFGVAAIWLSQCQPPWTKWASIFGLFGQPFWFYATWTNEQWGMFALCFLYTIAWSKGFYKYWVKPCKQRRN